MVRLSPVGHGVFVNIAKINIFDQILRMTSLQKTRQTVVQVLRTMER